MSKRKTTRRNYKQCICVITSYLFNHICSVLDGDKTLMMQTRGDDVFGTLYQGKLVGKVNIPEIIVDQLQFWSLSLVVGGVVAELSEKFVSSL